MRKCYIIGFPLKKPRSVVLWKNYFKKNKINSSMKPLELKTNRVIPFINSIKKDKNFLASAVTMPLKSEIYKHIIPGDRVALNSKAVNFILKKKEKIYGYNTDLLALLSLINKKYLKNILILGLGGVGGALFNHFKKVKKINVFGLSKTKKGKNIFNNLNKIDLAKINLLVNCTPIGSNLKNEFKNKSPLKFEELKKINKNSLIFDIIYKPKKTKLLDYAQKLKLINSNGIKMNSLQADIALKILHQNL